MDRQPANHPSLPRWEAFFCLLGALLTLVPLGCGVPDADGPEDTYGIDFSLPAGADPRGAIVFIVDGVNADIFQEMLGAGELPAIQRYFVDRGLYCPRAVANTPSVTLANLTSLATGRFPGHHNVVGVNWFDRNQLLWRDYSTIDQKNALDGDCTAAMIYEAFPDRTTFSVFFQPHRGATKFIENWTSSGPPFFFDMFEFVDRQTLFRLHIVADVARQRGEFPAVTYVYLLAPDFRAYRHGVSSLEYAEALRHTDRQIGRVLTRRGEVEFAQPGGPGGEIACRVVAGEDPLGWANAVPDAARAGEAMTPQQWLDATIETDYPDLPAQILAYFRSRRAGDIAVFAADDWDFDNTNHAGHGGLKRQETLVPLLLAGPGVPHGTIASARTVDVVPTILQWHGRAIPAWLDGRPLLPQR